MSEPVIVDVPELIAALRSGKFKQGAGALHNYVSDTYCCLGVACEILYRKGFRVAKKVEPSSPAIKFFVLDIDYDPWTGSSSFLPIGMEFPKSMGIESSMGIFQNFPDTRNEGKTSLVDLNDEGVPFSHIADLLQYLYENPIKENV